MGKTNISWTATRRPDGTWSEGYTFNPWWGCQRVSPGCEHCYAETFAKRVGLAIWGPGKTTQRRMFGAKHWEQPLLWNRDAEQAGERRRVFCASMADVFEEHPMVAESREKLWSLIRLTPNLDWLLLTKRPENIGAMMPDHFWPNVWLGTSTEDQQCADERIPVLLRLRDRVPVLFLSAEPLLGPIDLDVEWMMRLDWIIAGGESGPKHRPMDPSWVRWLRRQCDIAGGVAFHFKQHGGRTHAEGGCLIDGVEVKEFPTPRQLAHA